MGIAEQPGEENRQDTNNTYQHSCFRHGLHLEKVVTRAKAGGRFKGQRTTRQSRKGQHNNKEEKSGFHNWLIFDVCTVAAGASWCRQKNHSTRSRVISTGMTIAISPVSLSVALNALRL